MVLGKNKRSFGVTAAIISFNYYNEIKDASGACALGTFDNIAEMTNKFEEKNKHREWETRDEDYESAIHSFVEEQIREIIESFEGYPRILGHQ